MVSPRRRVVGFMGLAREILTKTPGLTAQEVYRRANEIARQENRSLSAAMSPQGSLVATLHKHHESYGLERRQVGRQYRYFPAGSGMSRGGTGATVSTDDCCLALPAEVDKGLEALVTLGRFSDKHDARQELIAIGLQTLMAKLAR